MVDSTDPPTPPSAAPDAARTPAVAHSFRTQLTPGADVVDPVTWAGSVPYATGIAPRMRIGHSRWFNLLWLLPLGFVVLIGAVAAAQHLRSMSSVQVFIEQHPGASERGPGETSALPAWLGAQHFLNLFLMVFIIRSGAQILTDHPRLYWTRHSTPGREWFRIQKPVPADPLWTAKKDSISLPGQVGLPGIRHSIGLARWWHLGTNTLWLLNGLIFYVLLLVTGQWRHVIPTSWDVFPNTISVLLQYLSLDWPTEDHWVAYNGLQLLAYFVTVFVAAPVAMITGLGMSPALSTRFRRVSKVLLFENLRVSSPRHGAGFVVLRPETRPQPVSDPLVQVVLLDDIAGVAQKCAVDVRGNRGPRPLKFELVITGGALLKRCENPGDDVVDQGTVLVVVVTIPVRVVSGRSSRNTVSQNCFRSCSCRSVLDFREVEGGADGRLHRRGSGSWRRRPERCSRHRPGLAIDFDHCRIDCRAVDAVEVISSADQMPTHTVGFPVHGRYRK